MIVARFLDWVVTAPSDRRAEAVGLLARAWLYSDLSVDEAEAAEAALTAMLDDPSVRVRRSLAEALGRDPKSPSHIILSLAYDHVEVAEIVLGASPVLLDEDLIDIAAGASSRIQVAIASRAWVSVPVCAAIAEVGSVAACIALCNNYGAEMAAGNLRRIADRHGSDPILRQLVFNRHDCPVGVRQVLVSKIGEALGNLTLVKATIDDDRLSTIMREACDKATVALSANIPDEDVAGLVEHLCMSGQMTPSLLLRALCTGHLRLFEQAVSRLSCLPLKRVTRVLSAGRTRPVFALFERAGLPRSTWQVFSTGFEIIVELEQQGASDDIYAFSRLLLQRVQDLGVPAPDRDVQRLLALLRRFAAESARDAARRNPHLARLAA